MKSFYLHIMFSQINRYLIPGHVKKYIGCQLAMNHNLESSGIFKIYGNIKMPNNILTVILGNNKRHPKATHG